MKRSVSLISGLILLLSSSAFATKYEYHPNTRLYMGGGYNPYKPTEGYFDCIEHDGERAVDSPGAVTTLVRMEQIKTRQEFYQKIDFSASIAGSYMVFSGENSVSLEDERAFHSDSLTWMILFKSDYGRYNLSNPRLKAKYASLDDDQLYEQCGSEIVIERRKSAMVYALFTVHNVDKSERSKFEANLKSGAGDFGWSASMESSYKKILREASANQSVRLSVFAIGGGGMVDLANLIRSDKEDPFEKYSQVPTVLSEYIKTMTAEKSVPTTFITKHISAFKNDLKIRFGKFDALQIGQLFNLHSDSISISKRLDGILRGQESNLFELREHEKQILEKQYEEYLDASNAYFEAAKDCFKEEKKCVIPHTKRSTVIWPETFKKMGKCQFYQKKALQLGVISRAQYNDFIALNVAPLPLLDDWNYYAHIDCSEFTK